ncbi:MAG: tripartite tricarboxylate transporter TctB family protein [Pseudomonadota bacterium]
MSRFLNERVFVLFVLLLVAAALYASTFTQSFSDVGNAHSPVFFPRIILVLWLGLALIALIQTLIFAPANAPLFGLVRLAILIAAAVAYTMFLNSYGFFLTSAAFAVVCLIVFGVRNPLIIVLYAVAVPGGLVALFNHVLKMPLPTSPFTFYF